MVVTKLDVIKKHSRTSPDVQFKELSMTKQKIRPTADYGSIGKTISNKNQIKKQKTKTENQCQNATRENRK